MESTNIYDILLNEGKPKEEILHILQERSRDNSRTPMQWDCSPNAGFTTGTPWLGVNENYREINAEQALADPDSVFYFYQKLIRLRKESPVVQEGRFLPLLEKHPRIFAFERKLEGEGGGSLLVFCNFYGTEAECEPGVSLGGYGKILGNYPETGGAVDGAGKLQLKPYEVVVLEK